MQEVTVGYRGALILVLIVLLTGCSALWFVKKLIAWLRAEILAFMRGSPARAYCNKLFYYQGVSKPFHGDVFLTCPGT